MNKACRLLAGGLIGWSCVFSQAVYAQGGSRQIQGEVAKDEGARTFRYTNELLQCSFEVPSDWTLMAQEYNPKSKTLTIGFAKYSIAGSILHGGRNYFVSLTVFKDALKRYPLQQFLDSVFYPAYKSEFGAYGVRLMDYGAIVLNGHQAVRRERVVGVGRKSKQVVDYWIGKYENIYFLSVDVVPGGEGDRITLPPELEQIVQRFRLE